jgi:hypothetical protein
MRFLLLALVAVSTASFADGPGTRILTTPSGPQRSSPAAERDLQRCEALRDEAKQRCMKDVRAAIAADEKQRGGPEATGAGSGAGSGASSGTSGGGTAPR